MAESMPMSLEELEEYDHETCKLVTAAERLCQAADAEFEDLNATAKAAKKSAEFKAFDLRQLIREREHNRGKRPEATLLDLIPEKPSPWRQRNVGELSGFVDNETLANLKGVENLGELYQQVHEFDPTEGCPFGLTLPQVVEIRRQLEIILNAEVEAVEAVKPTTPPELWREFPIGRWEQFGITKKDIEKLSSGEVKRETGRRPIVTVGDLSNFSAPTGTGYSRTYADIKGIGAAGADRISEAETKFWAWWKGEGESTFAKEKGYGDAPIVGTGSGVDETPISEPVKDDPYSRGIADSKAGRITSTYPLDTPEREQWEKGWHEDNDNDSDPSTETKEREAFDSEPEAIVDF